jgi:hypothetical protein
MLRPPSRTYARCADRSASAAMFVFFWNPTNTVEFGLVVMPTTAAAAPAGDASFKGVGKKPYGPGVAHGACRHVWYAAVLTAAGYTGAWRCFG